MLVSIHDTQDPDVDVISNRAGKWVDQAFQKGTRLIGFQYGFIPSSFFLLRHPWYRSADVIQLYNTHGGYFSHSVLPLLARGKKVVWRLSDLWPITGHCTFPEACDGWKTGCHPCPHLDYYPSLPWDSTSWLFAWKKKLYSKTPFHVVAPSMWAKRAAEASPLLQGKTVSYIPNGVDTDIYKPMDKAYCRSQLGVPHDKKVILFTTQRLPNNPRKGGDFYIEAMNRLSEERNDLWALLVGEGANEWGKNLRCGTWRHETVQDTKTMAVIYNAADMFAHPALGDNLPNTVLESMSCGIPAAVFDAGGVVDAISHKATGFLAKSGHIDELVDGFRWGLSGDIEEQEVSRLCRAVIMDRFALRKQAESFMNLYQSLLEGPN
jgi:glycosyltransferase involved in cell wall biosynthesis